MELILWRHADAEDPGAGGDLARALTKRGRHQAERVGAWLADRLDDDWLVLSSPARRAVQTARALGRELEECQALAPGASPADVLKEAGWPGGARGVVIVGHQPTLGEVASRLLGGPRGGLAIRKAAAWWFASRGDEVMLRAVVDAETLAGRG